MSTKLHPGDTALFFTADHGVALGTGNYLLPSDVSDIDPGQELRLADQSVAESDIIATLQDKGARAVIMILDACRNNLLHRRGLRSVGLECGFGHMPEANGIFTLYSAGYGNPLSIAALVQMELNRLHCDTEPVNGSWTPRSRDATLRLSRVRDLAMNIDEPDEPVLEALSGLAAQGCPATSGAQPKAARHSSWLDHAPESRVNRRVAWQAIPKGTKRSVARHAPIAKASAGLRCFAFNGQKVYDDRAHGPGSPVAAPPAANPDAACAPWAREGLGGGRCRQRHALPVGLGVPGRGSRPHGRASFPRTRLAVSTATCEALGVLELRAQLPAVVIPTLVMVGEIDEATRRRCPRLVCRTPASSCFRAAPKLPDRRSRGASSTRPCHSRRRFHDALGRMGDRWRTHGCLERPLLLR